MFPVAVVVVSVAVVVVSVAVVVVSVAVVVVVPVAVVVVSVAVVVVSVAVVAVNVIVGVSVDAILYPVVISLVGDTVNTDALVTLAVLNSIGAVEISEDDGTTDVDKEDKEFCCVVSGSDEEPETTVFDTALKELLSKVD